MAFQIDSRYTKEGVLPGEYECVVISAYPETTSGGHGFLKAACKVREDFEQEFQGEIIEYRIWEKRNPNNRDRAAGGYSAAYINDFSSAVGIAHGTSFETLEDLLDAWIMKPARITLEANGKYTNVVRVEKTRATHKYTRKEPDANNNTESFIDHKAAIDDEDLPF